MTSLPDIMPELQGTERLSLRFRNTSTQSLHARGYLQKTKELDLRGSELEEVSREAGLQLKGVVRLDMRNNRLSTLPDSLRVVSPDAVLLDGNLLQ
jgi:Leucine-rich repeat (LRR) protein